MGDLDSILDKVEKNGAWTPELTSEYLTISNQSNSTESDDNCTIRPYKHNDKINFEKIISRIGNYSIQEIIDDGYEINILNKEKRMIGVITSRDDGIGTYIGAIAINPGHEGHGYAQKLIGSIDTGEQMSAKIDIGNTRSMNLFSKYGFSPQHIENGKRWMIREFL